MPPFRSILTVMQDRHTDNSPRHAFDGFRHPFHVEASGVPFQKADGAVVLLHGRGSTAREILQIMELLDGVDNIHAVAPQARDCDWYPGRFNDPLESNEPYLSDALGVIDRMLTQLIDAGMPTHTIFLGGFSQGACLSLEYLCRHPRKLGGVFALAGGLMGAPGTEWNRQGSADGTPVYLSCAEEDSFIPIDRVEESSHHLQQLGCEVTLHKFPGGEHRITEPQLEMVESMLNRLG